MTTRPAGGEPVANFHSGSGAGEVWIEPRRQAVAPRERPMRGRFVRLLALGGILAARLVTTQAADGGAPVHNVDGLFIREWLVLGPFPSRDMEADLLASAGGEAKVRPREGDVVTTAGGKRLTWTRLRSDSDMVELEQVFGICGWSVAYAYCELNSDERRVAGVRAMFSDGAVLWLNGTKVGPIPAVTPAGGNAAPAISLELKKGRNAVLLKLRHETTPWQIMVQPLPSARGSVILHVRGPSGNAVPAAAVEFYDHGQPVASVQTGESGEAAASLYPLAARYDLKATAGELGAWSPDVVIPPAGRRELEIRLETAVSISGRVLALDGSPQTGIAVQALYVSRRAATSSETHAPSRTRLGESWSQIKPLLPLPPFSEAALTGPDGSFRFVNLRPGEYRLRCEGPQGFISPTRSQGAAIGASAPVHVVAGQAPVEVNFQFPEAKKGVWRRFLVPRGLGQARPESVYRAPDGRLWIGTEGGTLHVFDGVSFEESQSSETSGPEADLRVMQVAADGSLWVGAKGGACRLVGGRLEELGFNNLLPRPAVLSLQAETNGVVWLGTASGLWRYDGGKVKSFTAKDGLPNNVINSLLRARDGKLWLGTWNGLAWYDGQQFHRLEPFHGFGGRWIGIKLFQAKDGAIWFYSGWSGSVSVYRFDGTNFWRLSRQNGLPDAYIDDIAQTSDGTLWFATSDGLSRFNGTTVVNYTEEDGLGARGVRCIFVDPDDVLWCATDQGIARFDPNHFTRFTLRDGLVTGDRKTAPVFAIEPDAGGRYWIGTEWGGAFRTDGKTVEPAQVRPPEPRRLYVRQIHRAADGTLWFGTADGIYRLEQGRLAKVVNVDWVLALSSDAQGNLWYGQGWNGGGLTRYNPKTGQSTSFTTADGLPDNNVWSLEPALDGGLWAGVEDGLAKFERNKIEDYRAKLGISTGTVWRLSHDPQGTLWICSSKGLHRVRGGKSVLSIASTNGLPDEHIWCSARTADGIIWMGTDSNGLLGYDGRAVTVIDKRDGLSGNRVFTLAAAPDGALYLGCLDGGLTRFRPTKTRPGIRLLSVRFNDRLVTNFAAVPRVKTETRIAVQYGEIDLKTLPEKRQFWCRITAPSGRTLFAAVTKDRQFEWTPHEHGHYTFEVQAIDRDLNYSAPARFSFEAVLPWYADAWILAPGAGAVAMLIFFSGFSGWRFRVKRLEADRLRDRMLRQEREAREALAQSNRSLETANKAKSAFLATMSHEIRTPLNAVLGYTKILRRDQTLSDDQRRSIRNIERNGEHLLTLINEILDLSKIEAGHSELIETDFDLRELILGLSAMFEPRCREKALEWRIEWGLEDEAQAPKSGVREEGEADSQYSTQTPPCPIPVHGDQGKLRQVLINILGNAVKFTERGEVAMRVAKRRGRMALTCGAKPEANTDSIASPSLDTNRDAQSATFVFEIEDTGPGVPESVQEKIFEPFTQAPEGKLKGGTGLGLAIAKRQIERMNGTIEAHAEPGKGSRFTFAIDLPTALAPLPAAPTRQVKRLKAGIVVRALVADDVPENRDILGRFLNQLGAVVKEVADGEQALKALRAERFDIAFMDIRMPAMSGFQVARSFLSESGAGRARLVAISASALKHEQKLYQETGFDDFVPKPFQIEDLAACLELQLGVAFEYEEIPPAENPTSASAAADRSNSGGGGESQSADLEHPIDWARLDVLFRDDPEASRRFLEDYVRTISAQIRETREALEAADLAKLNLLAHRCRGVSLNFGIRAMIGPTERLEAAAQAGLASDCERWLAQVEKAFEAVQKAIVTG